MSHMVLYDLIRYMCENWLVRSGKPQERTLQVTLHWQRRSVYARETHPAIMDSISDLKSTLTTRAKHVYTYRLIDEVSYRDLHKQLLPLELADWIF